jgi:hypothetical protein
VPHELGKLPADQIVPALPKSVWFNAVGTPLGENERIESERYLSGLGAQHCSVSVVSTWPDALALAAKSSWSATWWERERQEERKLFEQASSMHSPDTLLLRLSNLMQGSAGLFLSPASLACTRAGINDSSAVNAAAGAAAQCLHQYGLASITGQGDEHLFAAKFRLFLAGRWPLCVTEDTFFVF